MKFHIGDKFLLCDIECKVSFINGREDAYLTPDVSGDSYNNYPTITGLVFAILDEKGRDKLGNKAISINNSKCGAV